MKSRMNKSVKVENSWTAPCLVTVNPKDIASGVLAKGMEGLVVLAIKDTMHEFEGVVVHTSNIYKKIGELQKGFAKECFVKYEGEIVLSN